MGLIWQRKITRLVPSPSAPNLNNKISPLRIQEDPVSIQIAVEKKRPTPIESSTGSCRTGLWRATRDAGSGQLRLCQLNCLRGHGVGLHKHERLVLCGGDRAGHPYGGNGCILCDPIDPIPGQQGYRKTNHSMRHMLRVNVARIAANRV